MNAIKKVLGKFGYGLMILAGFLAGGLTLGVASAATGGRPAQGQPAQAALAPEAAARACANTTYTLDNHSGEFDARNSIGFVVVTFDEAFTCLEIETVNAKLAVANPTKANTPVTIETVDATHYRVFGDGAVLGGELSLMVRATATGSVFKVIASATTLVVAPATCAYTDYNLKWTNEADYGIAESGIYFRSSAVGQWSGFEWAVEIAAGQKCVLMETTNITGGRAMLQDGTALGVTVAAAGDGMVVYDLDNRDLPEEFLWSVSTDNRNLKGVLGTVKP